MTTIHTATERQRQLATDWHGGQASMLYAVSSTGALRTGTYRPRWSDGEPMTAGEWERDLAGRLADELREVVVGCNRQIGESLARGRMSDAADLKRDRNVAMLWHLEMVAIANADMADLS